MATLFMVDEFQIWGRSKCRCFAQGSCHLTTTGSIDELHAFAERIGLKRAWLHNSRGCPHYDLTSTKRAKALKHGAIFVGGREQAMVRTGRKTWADVLLPKPEPEQLSLVSLPR